MTESNGQPDRYVQTTIRWQLILWIAQWLTFLAWIPAARWLARLMRQGDWIRAELATLLGTLAMAASLFLVQTAVMLELRSRLRCIDPRAADSTFPLRLALARPAISTCLLFSLLLVPDAAISLAVPFVLLGLAIVFAITGQAQGRATSAEAETQDAAGTQEMEAFVLKHAGSKVRLQLVSNFHLPACYVRSEGKPVIRFSLKLFGALLPAERIAILAHELAHHAAKHVQTRIVLALATYAGLLAVSAAVQHFLAPDPNMPGRMAAMPQGAMVIWCAWTLSRALYTALSLRQERAANSWALEATRNPDAFCGAMRKTAREYHGEGSSGSWLARLLFQTHPTLDETIAQADEYRRTHTACGTPALGRKRTAEGGCATGSDTVGGPQT